jgi:hypothetical protein
MAPLWNRAHRQSVDGLQALFLAVSESWDIEASDAGV